MAVITTAFFVLSVIISSVAGRDTYTTLKEVTMFNTSNSFTLSVPDTRWYLDSIQPGNYPPHNIIKGKEHVIVEMAVAGFKRDELKVYTEENVLHVEGDRQDTYDETDFVHRGLGFRKFHKGWKLPSDLQIQEVTHQDGLLTIRFEKVVPENLRRKDYLLPDA